MKRCERLTKHLIAEKFNDIIVDSMSNKTHEKAIN